MSWSEAVYTIDEVGKKISKKKDSGIPPTNIIGLVFENVFEDIDFIRVSNIYVPKDTIVDKIRLCRVAGIAVIIKETEYPIDEGDGKRVADILVDGTIKIYDNRVQIEKNETTDKYTLSFIPGKYNSVWWIGFYSYSDHDVYNRNYNNVNYLKFGNDQDKIPDPVLPGAYNEKETNKWAFDQDFTNLDPETSITYPEGFANSDFSPVPLGSNNFLQLGDWQDFVDNTLENRPFVVANNSSGVAVSQIKLNPETYTGLWTDYLTAYDENVDMTQIYGWFSWINTLWMKEEYAEDGNSRRVIFSSEEEDGFFPVGFINKNREVMKGLWIPMYPNVGYSGIINPSRTDLYNKTNYANFMSTLKSVFGTNFCGPIYCVLRDLLWMMGRSTNAAAHFNLTNSFFTMYHPNPSAADVGVYPYVMSANTNITEFPYVQAMDAGGDYANHMYMSDDYGGTVSRIDGCCQYYGGGSAAATSLYISKLKNAGPTFGSYPIPETSEVAGSATGLCTYYNRSRRAHVWNGEAYDRTNSISSYSNPIGLLSFYTLRDNYNNMSVEYVIGLSTPLPAPDYKPTVII